MRTDDWKCIAVFPFWSIFPSYCSIFMKLYVLLTIELCCMKEYLTTLNKRTTIWKSFLGSTTFCDFSTQSKMFLWKRANDSKQRTEASCHVGHMRFAWPFNVANIRRLVDWILLILRYKVMSKKRCAVGCIFDQIEFVIFCGPSLI